MICTPCKDLLSQFYVMKQRASKHSKPSDIRKRQIVDMVVDFIDTKQVDCIVSTYSNLVAIHPDTTNAHFTEKLQNCNRLLDFTKCEAEDEKIIDDYEMKSEHFSEQFTALYEISQFEDSIEGSVDQDLEEFIVENEDVVTDDTKDIDEPDDMEVKPDQQKRSKTYQKSTLDSKQKEWLRRELKQSAVVLDTPLGLITQWCCKKCPLKSFSSENAFRIHLKYHLETSDVVNEDDFDSKQQITADDQSFLQQKIWIQQQLQCQKEMVETNNGTKPVWSCSQCEFVTNKRGSFRIHLQKVHTILMRGPNKHSCFDCRLRFDGESHLIVHRNCHRIFDVIAPHASYPVCESCKMLFVSSDFQQIHMDRHNESPETLNDLLPSVGVVHRNGETFLDDEVQDEVHNFDDPTCGHCLKKFASDNECKHHLMIYHATSFTCPFDQRVFDGIPTLSFGNHLRQCHANIFPDLKIACSFCKMLFETVYDKLAHMKKCQAKMFQCDHCDKCFFRKTELVHHLKVVTGLMVFAW